ncbi:MAG: alpha/beta fold family hydrolase [Myxococcaceae bacterium]|nr:alpha/beta fold family hydrolase [Myxococcaceae bacterium]
MTVTPMDEAKTASFTLGPPRGKEVAAVLLIHGFTGSPWEVRPLGEALAARGFHVHAIRLPGHGVGPEAMAWVTWRDWERAAEQALKQLEAFPRVFVAGLSMGALLGMLLAARHPQRVSGLALMAPVWKLRPLDGRLLRRLRWLPIAEWTGLWVKKSTTDIEDVAARADAPILPRYPLARLYDLFTIQDHARQVVTQVHCPTLVAAAEQDHVVDFRSVQRLVSALPRARLLTLRRGFHILPRDNDRALLAHEVAGFFDGLAARIPAG